MTKNEKKWAENYELLKEYIAEHRQLPDKKKVEHRSLLNWWKYNRKLIRQGKLDEMRTELLRNWAIRESTTAKMTVMP